jgi:hypothetical protein
MPAWVSAAGDAVDPLPDKVAWLLWRAYSSTMCR